MTFLSKLGGFLAKAIGIISGIGPILQPFLGSGGTGGKIAEYTPVVVNDLTQIASLVTTAEAFYQTPGSGATKLAAVTPLVLQILRTSQAFDGKKIANEALAEQGASKIVSGIADFMNSIHPDAAGSGVPITQ
jgi:hypothetical protein